MAASAAARLECKKLRRDKFVMEAAPVDRWQASSEGDSERSHHNGAPPRRSTLGGLGKRKRRQNGPSLALLTIVSAPARRTFRNPLELAQETICDAISR